jgi:5-methylcytosine-specific restriction endonuclease McrA
MTYTIYKPCPRCGARLARGAKCESARCTGPARVHKYSPPRVPYAERPQQREYDDRRGSPIDRGYDKEWRKVSKAMLQDSACGVCGGPAALVHHITPLDRGGGHEMSNLICVCRKCHRELHRRINRSPK